MSYLTHNCTATVNAVVNALQSELRPLHYREAYDRFVHIDSSYSMFSKKTDGAEKLRQMFAESNREVFVHKGYFYLHDWLTESKDILFRDTIAGNALTQQQRDECFYEIGRRHDYMLDKYGKANTPHGIKERQRRALLERSVKEYFRERFPMFYLEPTNHQSYKCSSKDDFQLRLGDLIMPFDVKEFTRNQTSIIPNVKPDLTYIFATLENERAYMIGFIRGIHAVNLTDIETYFSKVKEVKYSDLSYIASLLVALNMFKTGKSFIETKACFLNQ